MTPRRIALVALTVTLTLAAVFWAVFLRQTADLALTRVPVLDEAWYLRDAARLRDEGGLGHAPFVMSPGYTLLVAWLGAQPPGDDGVLGRQPAVLIGVQALMWLGCGLLPAWAVWRRGLLAGLAPPAALGAAAVAGVLVWLHAAMAVFARAILLDLPLTFLVALALAAVVAAPGSRRAGPLVAALALGLAAALRAHVLVLAVAAAPLAWRRLAGLRWRAAWFAVLALLVSGPVLVFSLHNSRLVGRAVGPSLNSGVNLYLGLQPEAGGLFTTLRGFQQAPDPAGEAFLEQQLQRPLAGPGDADRAWRELAWRRFREAPVAASLGWLRKLWLQLQAWDIAQVTPLGLWAQAAPVLRWLPVPWWLLVSLGLGGAIVAVRGSAHPWRAPALLCLGAFALLLGAQGLFFVVSRYRLVLAPALALLASLGVGAGWQAGRRGWAILGASALAVVLFTRPWGLAAEQAQWQGLEAHNLARRLLVLADHTGRADLREEAGPLLAAACRAAPRRTDPWADRARNLAHLGHARGGAAGRLRGDHAGRRASAFSSACGSPWCATRAASIRPNR
ncbi:MAG: hypothetical protein R3D98_10805 [Candidatus Krumholzibacteriia bacterium]